MDGAGAGGAARERRKQLTAAEAMNHKRQMAQMVERELALTGADSVTDFDDSRPGEQDKSISCLGGLCANSLGSESLYCTD